MNFKELILENTTDGILREFDDLIRECDDILENYQTLDEAEKSQACTAAKNTIEVQKVKLKHAKRDYGNCKDKNSKTGKANCTNDAAEKTKNANDSIKSAKDKMKDACLGSRAKKAVKNYAKNAAGRLRNI
ncbi:MAG: hypothetical protein J7L15_01440 [Clostridiales bacterium]|nr:hypothetical protein [Clostridiales bacterium]